MLQVIAFLLMAGCIAYLFVLKTNPTAVPATFRKYAMGGAILFFILMIKPFEIIPAGNRGLILTFGALSNKVLQPGIAFKIPFIQHVETVSLRPIQLDYAVEVGTTGAITKDNQTIGATIIFFYRYKEDQIVEMYSKYGEEKLKSIIKTTGLESFKMDVGNYAIFDLPTKQGEILRNTLTMARDKLSIYPVEIIELKIINYDWSDEFDKQISQTMHRAQQVKQKEQELLITEQEAQKKVKTAEADKQALIATAEGEKAAAELRAAAKASEGEGIRKYNESVQRNMELELKIRALEIEKIKAEKWNGQYVSTNNYTPIPIQQGALLGK